MISRDNALPRSAPEAQGISSRSIGAFLDAWDELQRAGRSEPHSFMMLRHGHVIAESWWRPYRSDAVQSVYSISKSVTSLAVGIAVAEGLFTIDDPVIDFFPDKLPDIVSPYLARLTVRDLLTMTAGHAADMGFAMIQQDDWVRAFLAIPLDHEPGSQFVYDSSATYMLSAIMQTITEQTLLDFLTPRLLDPIGAGECCWESCPLGIDTGGWGFSATTETLAKLGQLCLQRGSWNGMQLVPGEWIDTAAQFQVQQPVTWSFMGPATQGATLEQLQAASDYYHGYGYQFWRGRHASYRADGAFAQFIIMLPEQDAVIVMTSESPDMQGALDLVWAHLLPAFDVSTEGSEDQATALAARLAGNALQCPAGAAASTIIDRIDGRPFALDANSLDATEAALKFQDGLCTLTLQCGERALRLIAGLGEWRDSVTGFPGTPPGLFPSSRSRAAGARMAGAAIWSDDNILEFRSCFFETPHHDRVTCRFDGDRIEISFLNSLSAAFGARAGDANPFPERRPVLTGVLA